MKLKELKVGTKFKYAGYEFTKLADEKKSCYCLLNDKVFDDAFGETNNWAKSPIRKRLNEFDDAGNSLVLPKITKDDLVPVSLNYTAYKIPNGRTIDRITLLSWEEYIAYDFSGIGYDHWLRSGYNNIPVFSQFLSSSGGISGADTAASLAVRPALHLVEDIEVDI